MPSYLPSAQDAHIDSALTDFSIAYGQDLAQDFVALRGSTPKKVTKQSDYYYVWSKSDLWRSEMDLRADGAPSKSAGQRLSSTTYFCDVYALSTYLTQRQKVNADIDLEKAKIRYLSHQGMLKRDKIFAATVFGTGLWTSNTEQTGSSTTPGSNEFLQWNDSSSTPLVDVTEQIEVVRLACGRKPNTLIMSDLVLNQLRQHSTITDLFKYTSGGLPDDNDLAQVFGLGGPNPQILVGRAVENTGKEAGTDSISSVYGKHVLLAYIDPNPETDMPTAITSFSWSEFDQVTPEGLAIDSWWDQDRKAWKYEAEMAFDIQITANDAGVFMKNCIA